MFALKILFADIIIYLWPFYGEWLTMSESFVSEDEDEEDPQERRLRELKMRREHEDQMEIERQRREAREWDRQQRINPAPNPLLMPLEPSNMAGERSSDDFEETSTTGRMWVSRFVD